MQFAHEALAMAKKKAPPQPTADERVTLVNLKGTPKDKAVLASITKKTGVPLSEIVRRGIAMWIEKRGYLPPENWSEEE